MFLTKERRKENAKQGLQKSSAKKSTKLSENHKKMT